jgi:hypothetical protein
MSVSALLFASLRFSSLRATLVTDGVLANSYVPTVYQAIFDFNGNDNATHWPNWLFKCIGGPWGVVKTLKFCNTGCTDGGAGKSDYCA